MRIEHVNLTVSDLDRSRAFYSDLFGFRVRWEGFTSDGRRAVHLGTDEFYLALFEAVSPDSVSPDYEHVGYNHFGILVDNLDAFRDKLRDFGIETHLEADYDPGRRAYFFDPDGFEVEVVQYN